MQHFKHEQIREPKIKGRGIFLKHLILKSESWGNKYFVELFLPFALWRSTVLILSCSPVEQGPIVCLPGLGFSKAGTGPHSRRWAVGKRAKLHLYLQPLPSARITAWAPSPVRSAAALDSLRSVNPTVNCTCQGSRLPAPYETLMPDDLRWSWGGDASAGERLQRQIIISREVWLHRDHKESTACRLISKPYQWVASDN